MSQHDTIKSVAIKILQTAVYDSRHSTRIERRAELLSFLENSSWFSAVCAIAGVKKEDELKRTIRQNVIIRQEESDKIVVGASVPLA